MKTFFKWTVTTVVVSVVGTIVYRATRIADRTRMALTETEPALREMREAI